MTPKLLLRISALLMLFHLLLHTMGHSRWQKTTDPIKQAVISGMTNHAFLFMGTQRSMGDYFAGYGYAGSVALLLFACLLWLLSNAIAQSAGLIYKLLVVISICLLLWGIDEIVFFFPFAAGTTLLATLLTVIAAVQIRQLSVKTL